jgi:hypothetical protein
MSEPSAIARPRWVTAAVFALAAMIVWTVVVKYLVPLLWSLSRALDGASEEPSQIMWDLWPVTHAVLAVALWRGLRWSWDYGVLLAAAESAVVATKFALYLRAPEWSFWKLLWFTNKIYVLAFFLCLLAVLLGPGRKAFDAARRPRWAQS